jgi:hypothetical protein
MYQVTSRKEIERPRLESIGVDEKDMCMYG